MPEYARLLYSALKMPRTLIKHSTKNPLPGLSFCLCFTTVDPTALACAQLLEKTARALAHYPAPTKAIKTIILKGMYLYVWETCLQDNWSFLESPLVRCLQHALGLDFLKTLSTIHKASYYASLEKFTHWVFLSQKQSDTIHILYNALPHHMQSWLIQKRLIIPEISPQNDLKKGL